MADYQWESITLGQNKTIQDIASAAAQASELLNANVKFAQTGLETAQVFLQAILNPKIALLNAIADEIDNFVNDFRNIGFYVLEVTGDENYTLPKDADGNPIKLIFGSAAIATKQTAAASAGLLNDFYDWASKVLDEQDLETTGLTKGSYEIQQGKSTEGGNGDEVATRDPVTGMYKLTPSQIVSQMIAAIDDKLDDRRPQFSDSAEVGAIVLIIGFSDFNENLSNIRTILGNVISFFGGENGLLTAGFQKMFTLIAAALGKVENIEENIVTLALENVSGIRGNEENKEEIESFSVEYNFYKGFEVGDFVVGPNSTMGYVFEIVDSVDDEDGIYQQQVLKIMGASEFDAISFRNLSAGLKLQKAHYYKNETKYIDQNTGQPVTGRMKNDYKFFEQLTSDEVKTANTKVERKSGEYLLTVTGTENITQDLSERMGLNVGLEQYTVNVSVVGTIAGIKEKPEAPPPNFKSAKLEDLIGDFKSFYSAIGALTDTLRSIAGDSEKALEDFINFLDTKVEELDALNEDLQAILKLFSVGLPSGGIYSLSIPPVVGGNTLIKDTLQSADNMPPDDLDFSTGMLIVGGGPSLKVMQSLLAGGS